MSDHKPYTPVKMGKAYMVYCEHPDWPKVDFIFNMGKYNFWPCMMCYRQIEGHVLLKVLEPSLKNVAADLASELRAALARQDNDE